MIGGPGKFLAAAGLLATSLAGRQAAAKDTPLMRQWLEHCANNLKSEHPRQRRAVIAYCRCMAGEGELSEMLTWTQSDLEHSYPPAHRQCHDQSRLRPG